jgi:hypothetical protein
LRDEEVVDLLETARKEHESWLSRHEREASTTSR